MTIREHIAELIKYPNLDAELNLVVNIHNSEDDTFDYEGMEIAYMGQDKNYVETYDALIHLSLEEEAKRSKRRDESICELLEDNKKLIIELDARKENIVIMDSKNNVLRDIDVGGRFRNEENIVKILESILA